MSLNDCRGKHANKYPIFYCLQCKIESSKSRICKYCVSENRLPEGWYIERKDGWPCKPSLREWMEYRKERAMET